MPDAYISADLGQLQDYTAISLIVVEYYSEPILVPGTEPPRFDRRDSIPVFEIPFLDRKQCRYRQALTEIQRLSEHPSLMLREIELILDASGVGQAVLEMAEEMNLDVTPIVITGGHEARFTQEKLFVPRKEIISAVVVAYQARRIRIADGIPFADELDKEMQNLRLKQKNERAQETMEAELSTQHDDMAMSVGMGIWRAQQEHTRENVYTDRMEEDDGAQVGWDVANWGIG